MTGINPMVQIKEFANGARYPATKEEIIAFAQKHSADENVVIVLQHLPETQFKSAEEVIKVLTPPES